MSERCWVVTLKKGKPSIKRGRYEPENNFGIYGKHCFGIPFTVSDLEVFQTPTTNGNRPLPVFIVDPTTELAHSVGAVECTDATLGVKLEIVGNKKYVKAMVMKVFDLVQTLLIMAAGVGVALAFLILVAHFTGTPITFGGP